MSSVRGLDHVNFRAPAELIERLRQFYIDIVGLRQGPRPAFRSGSHGYWLYAGDAAVMHLSISAAGDAAAQATGWFNHLAFDCTDLAAMRQRLDAAGLSYKVDQVDAPPQVQLFLRDPCGLMIELNFGGAGR